MRREHLLTITLVGVCTLLVPASNAMGQLKERTSDAKTNRNLERWTKKAAAIGAVKMYRKVLGDIEVSGVSAMYGGSFEKKGANGELINWELIRYSRDGQADLLELQKNGDRVGPRVTCDARDITEDNVKEVLRQMDD